MKFKDIKRKSAQLRFKILNNTSYNHLEFGLVQEIVKKQKKVCDGRLKRYPYIFKYEYCIFPGQSNTGKGDLIFTNKRENFMVVEVKYLDLHQTGKTAKNRRTKKRKHIKTQTKRYMKELSTSYPDAKSIKGIAYTNESYKVYMLNKRTGMIKKIYDSIWKIENEVLKPFIDDIT